jgi:hypothetical protein
MQIKDIAQTVSGREVYSEVTARCQHDMDDRWGHVDLIQDFILTRAPAQERKYVECVDLSNVSVGNMHKAEPQGLGQKPDVYPAECRKLRQNPEYSLMIEADETGVLQGVGFDCANSISTSSE